jgi:hypothetical protein
MAKDIQISMDPSPQLVHDLTHPHHCGASSAVNAAICDASRWMFAGGAKIAILAPRFERFSRDAASVAALSLDLVGEMKTAA